MKRDRIIYYVTTGLLTLLILFSASMYFFDYENVKLAFESFGYPTYLIYPYATIKLIGLAVLWLPGLKTLKEWTYAGFLYAFVLAFFAHFNIGDGEHLAAILAIVLLLTSYIFYKRVY
ncbi:DoxX-like protein [Winogradskyella epiphytica]|uniref:DoxX-like protein n=1 Tax=Winogradskyella epiphytica TaxID=262005 RepID=A0A2V4XJD5_9FLAO|nr:DoxX family protein [Winogradskyella epiphytica]PYE81763.1 DoxX-like protein [Winogradskyella epiphytica]GGW62854.1 hypothetical protein GCM10008085_13320 [Winogradskyella epiphytica]